MSDRDRGTARTSLELVNIVEIISITVFITGGAFLASAALTGALGSTSNTNSIELSLYMTGAGLSAIGVFVRWLLSRYG
jgi:hypothetical protein